MWRAIKRVWKHVSTISDRTVPMMDITRVFHYTGRIHIQCAWNYLAAEKKYFSSRHQRTSCDAKKPVKLRVYLLNPMVILASELSTSYCESDERGAVCFSTIQIQYDKSLKNTSCGDEYNEIFVDTIQNKYRKRLYKDCQEIVGRLKTIQMQYNKVLYRDSSY